jgi:hypothetical protein
VPGLWPSLRIHVEPFRVWLVCVVTPDPQRYYYCHYAAAVDDDDDVLILLMILILMSITMMLMWMLLLLMMLMMVMIEFVLAMASVWLHDRLEAATIAPPMYVCYDMPTVTAFDLVHHEPLDWLLLSAESPTQFDHVQEQQQCVGSSVGIRLLREMSMSLPQLRAFAASS